MAAKRDKQLESYDRVKEILKETYPQGWFVGIAESGIVAAAPTFRELKSKLHADGKDIRQILVVEAGVQFIAHRSRSSPVAPAPPWHPLSAWRFPLHRQARTTPFATRRCPSTP